MKAIIPAAGYGTRFLPATKAQPKEMIPVLEKPIIQYVVEEAFETEVDKLLFITSRGKHSIEDHFDSSVELESVLESAGNSLALREIRRLSDYENIHYLRQQQALGLGHAVLTGEAFVGDDPFFVLLGDVIVPDHSVLSRLRKVHEATGASVIAVERVPDEMVSRYGIIDGRILEPGEEGYSEDGEVWRVNTMVEKPPVNDAPSNLAIFGRYLLTPRVMELLKTTKPGRGGEIQLTDALVELAKYEPIYAVTVEPGSGFDTGNVLSWLEANMELGLQNKVYGKQLYKLLEAVLDRYEDVLDD